MRLTEQVALVTGASSGLGLATAEALVARGAHVVGVDLPNSAGRDGLVASGARFVGADVRDEEQLNAALDAAEERGPLRAVVHAAGRGGDQLRILDDDLRPAPLASFDAIVQTNLVGTYNVLRLAAARMAHNDEDPNGDRGAIVLTASVAAFDGQAGQTAYTATKAAVHGITLVAARDLARWSIRVNTIAPGLFATPMLGGLPPEVFGTLAASVPHPRRLGHPAEFGRLAIELLENGYLNGETIRLDGAARIPNR